MGVIREIKEVARETMETVRNARRVDLYAIAFFLFEMYWFIGGISLAMKARGADIAYISFWHKPWRWVLRLV